MAAAVFRHERWQRRDLTYRATVLPRHNPPPSSLLVFFLGKGGHLVKGRPRNKYEISSRILFPFVEFDLTATVKLSDREGKAKLDEIRFRKKIWGGKNLRIFRGRIRNEGIFKVSFLPNFSSVLIYFRRRKIRKEKESVLCINFLFYRGAIRLFKI